jgi:hypothetical protein
LPCPTLYFVKDALLKNPFAREPPLASQPFFEGLQDNHAGDIFYIVAPQVPCEGCRIFSGRIPAYG